MPASLLASPRAGSPTLHVTFDAGSSSLPYHLNRVSPQQYYPATLGNTTGFTAVENCTLSFSSTYSTIVVDPIDSSARVVVGLDTHFPVTYGQTYSHNVLYDSQVPYQLVTTGMAWYSSDDTYISTDYDPSNTLGSSGSYYDFGSYGFTPPISARFGQPLLVALPWPDGANATQQFRFINWGFYEYGNGGIVDPSYAPDVGHAQPPGFTYDFDFGDGTSLLGSPSWVTTHDYASEGVWTASVTVHGDRGVTDTTSVVITAHVYPGTGVTTLDLVPLWDHYAQNVQLYNSLTGERVATTETTSFGRPAWAYSSPGDYVHQSNGYYWIYYGRYGEGEPLLNWARYPISVVLGGGLTTWEYFSATGPLDSISSIGAYQLPMTVDKNNIYAISNGGVYPNYNQHFMRAPITGGTYETYGSITPIYDDDDESNPEALTVATDGKYYWSTEGNYVWQLDAAGVKSRFFNINDADTVIDGVYTDTDIAGVGITKSGVMLGTSITADHDTSQAFKIVNGVYTILGTKQDVRGNRITDFDTTVYISGEVGYFFSFGYEHPNSYEGDDNFRYCYLSRMTADGVDWNYIHLLDDTAQPRISDFLYTVIGNAGSTVPPPLKLFQRDDSVGIKMSPRLSSTGNQPSSLQTNQAGRIPHGGNTYL